MEKKKPRQLYFKLFWTYTVIVVLIVTALTLFFISAFKRRILRSNEGLLTRLCSAGADYIEETEKIADYVFKDLYRSSSELDDLLAYFTMEPEAYQKYKLDDYVSTDRLSRRGIYSFITEVFEAYDELEKIEIISYEDFRMTECLPENLFFPGKDGKEKVMNLQKEGYAEEGKLIYAKEIRNPYTMEAAGCIIFTFEGQQVFDELLEDNEDVELLVLSDEQYPVYVKGESDWKLLLQEPGYLQQREAAGAYKVYAFMDRDKAAYLPYATFLTILGVAAASVTAGILLIGYYVRRLTMRVDAILAAMNQVTTGNLQVRVELQNHKDELELVAANFNQMCEELELYIQKSYLAEIERKNAQMQALQSQINPHFLYNTLEAIRMKAICNGDREVGKMLYSMVVLFRSQLKESDIITLGQELDYCKQYLELFEYRYQGSFHSQVTCSPELMPLPIIKFVLQPIVENYFVHGIQRDKKDNLVQIYTEKQGDTLYLYVRDNGIGMTREAIERKNRELTENPQETNGNASIGIMNVNRRIKAVYGEEYGVRIEAAKPEGLLVIVSIKAEEGETNEEGHVGGR